MDIRSLRYLANKTNLPIFVYEVEQRQFSYQNPAFEKSFNLPTGITIQPDSLLHMVHPEDQQYLTEAYCLFVTGEESEEIEFRIELPEQEERWVCLTALLFREKTGKQRIIGYMEDITASKQYQDYLKKYGNKKNSVLHILAHDLAGPLNMIQTLADELAIDLKANGNQDINKLIGLIKNTSAHGISLIKSLLDTEFLETTGVDLIKSRANIVDRFKEIMEQYEQSEIKIAKTFRFLPASDEIYVQFDDTKLMQAVNNLISNAIKFTPEGGVITVSLEENQETVLIKVEDNGVGIPQKYHTALFDKFTKARRPGLHGEPATGLGMSIVKTIVEWHNGHIWFESEENKGTCFYIEIPKE